VPGLHDGSVIRLTALIASAGLSLVVIGAARPAHA